MRYFLRSMRMEQWPKNLALFAGLVFSGNLLNGEMALKSAAAFLIFSLLSGAVYIINDIFDLESDKRHVEKSKRPIAAGKLKVIHGLVGSTLVAISAITISFILNLHFGFVVSAYFALNVLYSVYLKRVVIIDVLVISLDFVLRVLAGVWVLSIVPTPWIVICTIFLSLFLSLCKRRQEIILLRGESIFHREVLSKYPINFLDKLILFSSVSVVFSYILFTGISGKNINLMYTIPVVLYGVMRYLYLIYVEDMTFSPTEALVEDKPLLGCVILWISLVIIILYL